MRHYTRVRRTGTTEQISRRIDGAVEDRFAAKVIVMPNGCWHWNAKVRNRGYAKFRVGDRIVSTHRWSYERFVGPIPDGWTVDHTCHNRDATCPGGFTCSHRGCVNPQHLEVVPRLENSQRSPRWASNRTHCPKGHPYDEANTIVQREGQPTRRACRTCVNERARAVYRRKQAAKVA